MNIPTTIRGNSCLTKLAALILGLASAILASSAQAGNLYWDTNGATAGAGSTVGVWGTDTFWTASSAGTSATTGYTVNSDVFFSAGASTGPASLTVTGAQAANSLTFTQSTNLGISGGTALQIAGGGITVNSGAGTVSLTSPIQLTASQNWTNNNTKLLTIGTVTNTGDVSPFTVTVNGSGAGGTTFNGIISNGGSVGTTGLTINAANSKTTLSVANTYTGATTLTSGTIQVVTGALGAAASALNINGAVTLQAAASTTLNNTSITLGSDFAVGSSGNSSRITTASGATFDVGSATRTITLYGGNALTTSANAQLNLTTSTVSGAGVLRILGGAGASATAPSIVSFAGAVAFSGGAGLTIGANATTTFGSATPFSGSPNVIVEANGALNLSDGATNSRSLSIGSLSGAGTVNNSATAAGTATLTVNGTATTNFSGNIKDGGYNSTTLGKVALTINKSSGTQTLSGINTYTGATTVSVGSLLIGDTVGSTASLASASTVSVGTNGTLGGQGTIGGATTITNGKLAPGAGSTGSLEFGDNLSLVATTGTPQTQIELGGTSFNLNITEDYDRIKLTGATPTLTLAGTLNVALINSFSLSDNQAFGIFQLNTGATRSGTFSGLATDGSLVGTFGGKNLYITYSADFGDSGAVALTGGNDIALYTVPEPATWALMAFSVTAVMLFRRRRA